MKLLAPLLSIAASGTIARAITFVASRSCTVAKKLRSHTDRKSVPQLETRSRFSDAKSAWSAYVTGSAVRADWQRLNTYKIKKHTGYNAFLSEAIKASASDSALSFASSGNYIAGNKWRWKMFDVPSGAAGSEAGDFEIWTGASPAALTLFETQTISAGIIQTSSLPAAGTSKFVTIRKDGNYRAGLSAVREYIAPAPAAVPVGTILPFAGLVPPDGYPLCDHAEVSRETYAPLFAVIGTIYGAGDGSTTFNLPDLVGYFLRGGVPDGVQTPHSTAQANDPFATANDDANHAHGVTGNEDHTHDHSATTENNNVSHTHDTTTGTQSADHTHDTTTGNESQNHAHQISSSGTHSHLIAVVHTGQSGVDKWISSNWPGDATHTGQASGDHDHGAVTGLQSLSHTHTGTSGNVNADHTHAGTSGVASSTHTHALVTSTQSDAHKHNVWSANATHNHAVSGGDAETAPDHVLMNYIIRAV